MNYNQFLEKVVLPMGEKIVGSSFMTELRRLRKQDRLSEEKLTVLQQERLSRLLNHAVKHSPYYSQYKNNQHDDPVIFLKSFPILEKSDLRESLDVLLTKEKHSLIRQSSSGSSGMQTTVYFDKEEQSKQQAQQIRWWEWAGYTIGDPILQTGITPKRGKLKRLKDILFRTYYLPAFTHTTESAKQAFEWVKRQKKQTVLAGYASSLYVLSDIARKNDIDIRFKTAISWGDKLFDYYKKSIESIFETTVHETYASSEGFMIAAQKDLPYMYIMTPDVYLEILDAEGNEVRDGEMGHVVVTKLNNLSLPLIRYRIGDLAIKLPREEYPEKREFAYPLLQKVIGRDTDLIKTKHGKFMVVHSFTGIIEHYPSIRQYTVLQKELDGIVIQYIPDEGFDTGILSQIEREIQRYLDEKDFYIKFEEVDYIAPTASGKPQIIQSFLNKTI